MPDAFDPSRRRPPQDVYDGCIDWCEISREEALDEHIDGPVVVVFRNAGRECVDWLERDHPLTAGVGPRDLRSVRYYRQRPRLQPLSFHARIAAAPPAERPRAVAPRVARREQKTWIEIELIDEKDAPVPNAVYAIRLPDGSTYRGSLDALGRARFDGIDPGVCEVSFPEIDGREWGPK